MLGKYLDVVEHGQAPRRDVVDLKGEAFPQACSLLLEIFRVYGYLLALEPHATRSGGGVRRHAAAQPRLPLVKVAG